MSNDCCQYRLSIETFFLKNKVVSQFGTMNFLFINHENRMIDETTVEEVVATDATPEVETTQEENSETNTEVVAE